MITSLDKFPPHRHVHPPFAHQLEIFEKTRSWEAFALFWEMGLGKSKVLLDTAVWLFLNGEIDGVLILADKGSYMNWIVNEIPAHVQNDFPRRVAAWSSQMNAKSRDLADRLLRAKDDCLDFACINIEALSSVRGANWAEEFLQSHHALMIIDESTSIKSPDSKRSTTARRLARLADYRRIATGTPASEGPLGLYAQFDFLKPMSLGQASFSSFRARYAVTINVKVGPFKSYPKIVGYQNLEDLQNRINPLSSRLLKDECLDLPDKLYEVETVPLSPDQYRIYTQLKQSMVADLPNQKQITVINGLSLVEKLTQVCCGHIRSDDGELFRFNDERLQALLRLVEIINKKVIIWCKYHQDILDVTEALTRYAKENELPQYGVQVYGPTPLEERVAAIERFCRDPLCHWFIASPAVAGKSLTLTVCNQVIYYSRGWKLEERLQSEDRCHRIGQKNPVTYIDIITERTVEAKILKALRSKRDLQEIILDAKRLQEFLMEEEFSGAAEEVGGPQ